MKTTPAAANRLLSFQLPAFAATLVLLNACASVTARKVVGEPEKTVRAVPSKIYVRDFSAPAKNLRVDRSGAKLGEFQADLAGKLSASLAKQLDRSLAPTEVIGKEAEPKIRDAWLISGRFDRVEQGSRALRSIFGFGLGGTKVVTTTMIDDLSSGRPRRLMTIQTTGGSNATPGTVINLAPFVVLGPAGIPGLVAGAGPGALPGLGADVKRTAREITAVLSDYCYRRGLIFKDQALVPKPAGDGQLRLSDPQRVR